MGVLGRVKVELYGPFATRAAIRCTGKPAWTGGDRPRRRRDPLARPRSSSGRASTASANACSTRTAVRGSSRPARSRPRPRLSRRSSSPAGRHAALRPGAGVGAATPARVIVPSLGIDAPIAAGRDRHRRRVPRRPGLDPPPGWWRDGSAAGAKSGSILVAGHVDSAKLGAGVFYKLHQLRAGDRIELRTAGGATLPTASSPSRTTARRRCRPPSGRARARPPRADHLRRPLRRGERPLPRQHRRHRAPL